MDTLAAIRVFFSVKRRHVSLRTFVHRRTLSPILLTGYFCEDRAKKHSLDGFGARFRASRHRRAFPLKTCSRSSAPATTAGLTDVLIESIQSSLLFTTALIVYLNRQKPCAPCWTKIEKWGTQCVLRVRLPTDVCLRLFDLLDIERLMHDRQSSFVLLSE